MLQPAKKPKKELKQSDETNIVLGGNGFDINKYKWSPVPFNAQSMTIEKTKIETPLENVSTDKLLMPASTKRRQNWNLVNNLSSESTVNILTKEKKLSEQKIRPLTVLGDITKKSKWNNKIRKQKGIKLGFTSTKKWYLKICKENDILYEQEADDVIINDDYNNVKGPEMRPITATIIKVNEEEETSSVSSYDVFQNLIIKKANYEFDYGSKASLLRSKNGLAYTFSNGSLGPNFGPGLGGSSFMRSKKLEYNIGNGANIGLGGFGGNMITKKDFSFGAGSGLIKNSGFGIGYGSGSNLLKSKEFKNSNYDFEISGPSFNKKVITQTKIINGSGSNIINSGGISLGKNSFREMDKKVAGESYKFSAFPNFSDEKKNIIKLRVSNENIQKNQYDKTVKTLANQANTLIESANMANNMNMNMNAGNVNIITGMKASDSQDNNISAGNMMVSGMGAMKVSASQDNNLMEHINENMNMNAGMKIVTGVNTMRTSHSQENNLEGNLNMMNTGGMKVMAGMTTVRTSGSQDNNLMGNLNTNNNMSSGSMKMVSGMRVNNMRDTRNLMGEKRKKIEFIREEPEQTNYLRI